MLMIKFSTGEFMNNLSKIYTFDDFKFDTSKYALYHQNSLVKNVDKKTLQLLAVLLNNPQKLTTHEEIIEQVWQDNPLGITSNHIGQYIKRLRKVFAEYSPENKYIETFKGRGYSFTAEISSFETSESEQNDTNETVNNTEIIQHSEKTKSATTFLNLKIILIFAVPVFVLIAGFWGWNKFVEDEEENIRKIVKESQLYESLVLYKNPAAFTEIDLDKYWTSELNVNSNYDRQRIRDSVKKMVAEGRKYGNETKCEQFEFQSVEINEDKNFAVVKTLEKWFIAIYSTDGVLQKNKHVGPYFVSYTVRKVNGQWLIEKSNTGRMIRPIPRLMSIEPNSEVKSGQQFFVKINGQDFEAENIFLEVFGEGCPENNPCKVPNSVLREKSKITETQLENVPLTLSSGNFRVVARNGDSQVSNPVYIKVP